VPTTRPPPGQLLPPLLPSEVPDLDPTPSALTPSAPTPPEPPSLILHIDFCQLRGSKSLGSATARLALRRWGAAAVQYEAAVGADVIVRLYADHEGQQGQRGSSSGGGGGGGDGGDGVGTTAAKSSAAGPAWEDGWGLEQDGGGAGSKEEEVAAGEDAASSAAAAEPAAAPPDPASSASAHALLESLVSGDEVMADLALFDGAGRLLVGR
jgi:hypothetical protein